MGGGRRLDGGGIVVGMREICNSVNSKKKTLKVYTDVLKLIHGSPRDEGLCMKDSSIKIMALLPFPLSY